MKCKQITPLLALLAATWVSAPQAAEPGATLYTGCLGCHGAQGEGNAALQAPAIGGLPAWYVTRELNNFLLEHRGSREADSSGNQMRQMATATLKQAEQVDAVAAHIATLRPRAERRTLGGNVVRGRQLYEPCQVCHGPQGGGKARAGAPPLNGLQDWYVAKQIRLFKGNLRGYHAADPQGQTMRALMKLLPTEADVDDVASYIGTLPSRF